jgi:hypothetical protein
LLVGVVTRWFCHKSWSHFRDGTDRAVFKEIVRALWAPLAANAARDDSFDCDCKGRGCTSRLGPYRQLALGVRDSKLGSPECWFLFCSVDCLVDFAASFHSTKTWHTTVNDELNLK